MFMRDMVNVTVYGFLPVVPMMLGSMILVIVVSLMTKPPSRETIEKYFPIEGHSVAAGGSPEPQPAEVA